MIRLASEFDFAQQAIPYLPPKMPIRAQRTSPPGPAAK
jgi:hypothetical protein